jgi:hypothetical protein
LKQLATDLVSGFFKAFAHWVASGTTWLLHEAWHGMSATTEPVLTGAAFSSEYQVMILIGLGGVAPMLGLAVIQAIARQDPSGLLRTALLRLPTALLLTGVVIELVSLGLRFTDEASVALLTAGAGAAGRAFGNIEAAVGPVAPAAYGFGQLLLVLVVALVGFMLWVELAVRSAAVAVATLFLPLALAGLVWPATSHWARRLGETLAGLVLMKLVMAAVLALAGGALAADAGGISSLVEGVALLGLTAFSPFVLFRLIPIVEGGAVGHLEGARPAQAVKDQASSLAADGAHWVTAALSGAKPASKGTSGQEGVASLPGAGGSVFAAGAASRGRAAARPSSSPGATGGDPGRGEAPAGRTGEPAAPGSGSQLGEAGWVQHIVRRSENRSRGPS